MKSNILVQKTTNFSNIFLWIGPDYKFSYKSIVTFSPTNVLDEYLLEERKVITLLVLFE